MIGRRDLFKAAAVFAALLVLPVPLRRLATDVSPSWFAEVPIPDGWGMQSVHVVHDGTYATWRVVLAKFGPDTPRGWVHIGGGDRVIPAVFDDPTRKPEVLETQTVEGTFGALPGVPATILVDVVQNGVLRLSWRANEPYRWKNGLEEDDEDVDDEPSWDGVG